MQIDENVSEEKKQANAFLREGKDTCHIRMFDNTEVFGTIKAFDLNFENVVVENLKTPLPQPLKSAILRTNDILTISLE
ncbi:hypothetical protein NQ318_022360 [Aromia moschata]|uniref:LSM domain-containing protein n=1 Tax=Aromia moschata TaxID=1265417 RepID=A0AAV8Z5H9_9CUCU|nr:hypothetical protein NQ318_022360 [Aromia moschata]